MLFLKSLNHAFVISFFVINMMIITDYANLLSAGRFSSFLQGRRFASYIIASFLGALPGCLGPFMVVSLYMHGFVSFGALVGTMIATSGDESYLMLALFPRRAILIFLLLFLCGIVFGWLSDILIGRLNIAVCDACDFRCCLDSPPSLIVKPLFKPFRKFSLRRHGAFLLIAILLLLLLLHPDIELWMKFTFLGVGTFSLFVLATASDHYVDEHVIRHALLTHGWKVFLWTFGFLLLLNFLTSRWDVVAFFKERSHFIFASSALAGIIPESGPHMFFSFAYAKGLIPFSILFVNSFVQDGHGLLPLLSHSLKDAAIVKLLNLIFGVVVGGLFYILGF
ncbi:MAG: arsenic efflux protein [Synergistetes bacterium]|nr:arsenic efflux protein [Synergistota bacterium]